MGDTVRRTRARVVIVVVVAGLVAAATAADASRATAIEASATPARYEALTPFRLADTRRPSCGCVRIDPSNISIDVVKAVGRTDVVAAAVTITATATTRNGFVTAYAGGRPRPETATLATRPDRAVSNATIVPVGDNGAIALYQLVPGDLVVDVTGVFVAVDGAGPSDDQPVTATAGRFVPLTPRRLADTRASGPLQGALPFDGELTIPRPSDVPADATALAVTITSVGASAPGYLSIRPAGAPLASTAILTMNGSGQAVAATTLATISVDGLTIRSRSGGHVVVDVTGWFTGPSSAASSSGLFIAVPPRRLHDTRAVAPRIWPGGTIEVRTGLPDAAAVVSNLTATRADRRGFVAAYPAGTPRPTVSAVNPAFFQHTIANLSIVPTSTRGVAYYGASGTDIVVDITGYFTGTPMPATARVAPNVAQRSRVMLVGDSTLAGLNVYTSSQQAFVGFDPILDAQSCRRLLRPSCLSDVTGLIPNTAVEAIRGTPGRVDVVVVKTGYNDWFSDFPTEFNAVVTTARAKGAHTILWMTYNERIERNNARRAYQENNADLRWLVTLPQYADVILADWYRYSDLRFDWFYDGTHTTPTGSYAIADYVSRWIAAIEHRPCPRPQVVGGQVASPCAAPDITGPVPDPVGLYR